MQTTVVDPNSLNPDPDPGFLLNPDPGFDDQKIENCRKLRKKERLFIFSTAALDFYFMIMEGQ
jgi:hypothetical protein